ncbi:MAG TPA: ATP-binding protein [Candidatus Saccharimonadia bacterium]|jgi:PAS domain S-box-containing protein|nr:ATP-binding protein [Candidatus Saccharimonadia bacterium]
MQQQPNRFIRRSLALFFIISLIPALVVAAVWYLNGQTGDRRTLDFTVYVLPVMILGILPAMILSFVFAELLARPVRRIHQAALELARGNFKAQFNTNGAGEFAEIGEALNRISGKLQQTLSEANSETALIAAERGKLHSVLNSMTDGVFALDRSGRIILFNKAATELTGRTIGEVAGQLAEKVMPFRSHGELVMTRFLASGAGTEHKVGHWTELELYRADGRSLIVNVEAVVLKDDPNGISALVTFHDLTKARQLEEMKIDFVALAAHELRTPLTEIKGYLDILHTEAKGLTKAQKQFLTQAMTSAGQLGDLMRNLLNVARIEHGELNHQPELIDYRSFIMDMEDNLKERAEQQNRKIVFDIPKQPIPILADPSALREVISNLVSNAISHTQAATGHIEIRIATDASSVITEVIDNGTGIPSSAIPHLFTKFFRVDEFKSTTHGTGLGLYICRSIVEAHNGHITVESTLGKGSTFTFILPRRTVATTTSGEDNKLSITTRGAHGWIKKHPVR